MVKALLVEDENKTRAALLECVRWAELGISELAEASNGKQALELVASFKPDLILTDIRMPEMSGIELAEELYRQGQEVSLIMMSAYSDMDYLKSAIKLRSIDYLLKPVDVQELESAVLKAIGQREQRALQEAVDHLVETSLPVLQEQFFHSLLHADPANLDNLQARLKSLQLPIALAPPVSWQLFEFRLGTKHTLSIAKDQIKLAMKRWTDRASYSFFWTHEGHVYAIVAVDAHIPRNSLLLILEDAGMHGISCLASAPFADLRKLPEARQAMYQQWDEEHPRSSADPFGESVLIQAMKQYISTKYWDDKLTVMEIADALNYTSAYICMVFKKATGMTLNHYLNGYRVEKAKQLMNDVTLKIADVAELVGYSSENYFSKVFKKYEGLSPSEFKRGGS